MCVSDDGDESQVSVNGPAGKNLTDWHAVITSQGEKQHRNNPITGRLGKQVMCSVHSHYTNLWFILATIFCPDSTVFPWPVFPLYGSQVRSDITGNLPRSSSFCSLSLIYNNDHLNYFNWTANKRRTPLCGIGSIKNWSRLPKGWRLRRGDRICLVQ